MEFEFTFWMSGKIILAQEISRITQCWRNSGKSKSNLHSDFSSYQVMFKLFKDHGKQMWHLKYHRSRLSAFETTESGIFYTVVFPDNLSTHENYQKLSIKKNSRNENFIMSLPMRNKCQIKKKRKTTTWGPWSKCLDTSCDTDLAIKIRR